MKNYENRFVLFLDILGFKKIISETIKSEEEIIEKTTFLIETIKEIIHLTKLNPKGTSKNVTQFSDSIVISFKEDDTTEIPNLFHNLLKLVSYLMSRDILCRGAVSYGKLYHKDDIVFGPALVDAYETESQAALYPRIILDRSVVDLMKSKYTFENKLNYRGIRFDSKVNSYLRKDTDDKYYIDYFTGAMIFFKNDQLFEVYENFRKLIINGLKYKNSSVNIKFGWLKNKYNKIKEELIRIDKEEEAFYTRPDMKEYHDKFKPI